MSEHTLYTMPGAKLQYSPCLLYPYGNSKPFRPLGQVELVCEKNDKYHVLIFPVLQNHIMGNKPALLSGADSELLGLIHIEADNVFSVSAAEVDGNPSLQGDPPAYRIAYHKGSVVPNNGVEYAKPSSSKSIIIPEYYLLQGI